MSRILRNRITGELFRHSTLGDQVLAEARRRGEPWAANAVIYARRAEAWYGRRPCRGEDLRTIFDAVFGAR
ncbi:MULTISPECIES: hypothetical protein [unclassified Paraburkholderia]|uniref:hypothetical protein n=1 Tax=unclassified Paraburkholderia TaxID=2615204 RepID=UPI001615EB47|nr:MULTISPECIES: hypothetical protein [unclassified Paraburkholderia]MBB5442939.1 hypothetical protein [Paraburkholderia sp. WSM4177]MBB5483456.1 hypothetical protein [Paraburkholderia sp. WSM4180]